MYAYIQGANAWLDEHIRGYILYHVPDVIFIDDFEKIPKDAETVFLLCDGWSLNRCFTVINAADKALLNAYPNSDALARKDYLAKVVEYWTTKRPESTLNKHVPQTVRVSFDYSEYADDALMAADDLTLLYSLEDNEEKQPEDREWWIMKPAMLDCGAGIRIFSTIEELASNLELAEDIEEEEEEEGESEDQVATKPALDKDEFSGVELSLNMPGLDALDALVTTAATLTLDDTKKRNAAEQYAFEFDETQRIPSAMMREFVVQRYITSVPPIDNRKWHVRAYVVSMGRLKIHVFREMLLLLALQDYKPPWENPSLKSSLTNTSLQNEDEFTARSSMRDFWAAPDHLLPGDWKARVFDQICGVSAEVFRAAVHTMADKFTTVDKCFELFALDFLIDRDGNAWLLEANETPAFYEYGPAGRLATRLMESVVCLTMEHMGLARTGAEEARGRMVEVLDESSTLAKSNITQIVPEE